MSSIEKMKKLINEHYPSKVYAEFDNCLMCYFETKAASRGIHYVFKIFPEHDCCIYFNVVESYDKPLCDAILGLVEKGDISEFCTSRILRVVGGLEPNKYQFNSLAIINHEVAGLFYGFDDELSNKFTRVFPVYDCELSGNETRKQLIAIQREMLVMSRWKRKPSPKIYLRYRLKRISARTYRLCSDDWLVSLVDSLTEHGRFYIEMLNYKEEYIKIFYEEDEYRVINKKKELYFNCKSNKKIHQWIQEYLHKGIFVDGKELTHLERETLPD